MCQGYFSQNVGFLGQKVCSVARGPTDDRHTDAKVKTKGILSGFQDFFQIFLQPIIKERSIKETTIVAPDSKMRRRYRIQDISPLHSTTYINKAVHYSTPI